MTRKLTALLCALLMGCTAAQWNVVSTDLGNIAQSVLADVLAGKPFDQVLADTITGDVTLLITVIGFIESDMNPKITPAERDLYVTKCAPYLAQAIALKKLHGG